MIGDSRMRMVLCPVSTVGGRHELSEMTSIPVLLERVRGADAASVAALLPHVYQELRRMAGGFMSAQPTDHTLQATALVNETVAKLLCAASTEWKDRAHFLSIAAAAMRQVLIDHARAKGRLKRSADGARVPLDEAVERLESSVGDPEAVANALESLRRADPLAAQIVEYRFFLDLTMAQVALVLDIPLRTVEREWSAARAWLLQEVRRAR